MPLKDPEARKRYMRQYHKDNPPTREQVLASRRAKKAKQRRLIVEAKKKPCADCGVEYPPAVMEFDHVRGKKRFHVGRATGTTKQLLEEIAKCDVVCANCHRLRHYPAIDEASGNFLVRKAEDDCAG